VAIVSSGSAWGQDADWRPVASESVPLPPPSQSAPSESADASALDSAPTAEELPTIAVRPEELLATWIARALPRDYEKQEDWGRTKRITVGLDSEGRGLRIRIKRKKKDVPHGLWKHYRVVIPEAAGPPIVEVNNLRVVAPGRAAASIVVVAPLESWARTRLYNRGIHLGTYTAEGRARVHIHLECEVGVRLESEEGWPVLVVEPHVKRAVVGLHDFRLSRISNADGPVVRELGSVVEHIIEEELEPRKLTRKLNRAIDKKQDRLRVDPQELVSSGWSELIGIEE
jgi:hypothetical protein